MGSRETGRGGEGRGGEQRGGEGREGGGKRREGKERQLRDVDKGEEFCPPTSNSYIMIINDDSLVLTSNLQSFFMQVLLLAKGEVVKTLNNFL